MLAPRGIALIDDIERNTAFHSFADAVGDADCSIVARAEDGRALIGVIQKGPADLPATLQGRPPSSRVAGGRSRP